MITKGLYSSYSRGSRFSPIGFTSAGGISQSSCTYYDSNDNFDHNHTRRLVQNKCMHRLPQPQCLNFAQQKQCCENQQTRWLSEICVNMSISVVLGLKIKVLKKTTDLFFSSTRLVGVPFYIILKHLEKPNLKINVIIGHIGRNAYLFSCHEL